MKILLVYPEYPNTFWSFKNALKIIPKSALMPPLGLLTIASILPKEFEKKLVDMNVVKLTDKELLWADYVFISAMISQKNSVCTIIKRCQKLGVKTVAGGPLFTSLHENFPDIDYFVLNEAEITLPMFLEDIKNNSLKRIYSSDIKPDLSKIPPPMWELAEMKKYFKMPIQCSRGCPYDCEFCDIVNLNGKIPRYKTPEQILKELESLQKAGWNSSVFIVDDNFIGNKKKTKEILRALIDWKKVNKNCKMSFITEVSLDVADDDELLSLLREAGFMSVFIGIETASQKSLEECGKYQNKNRNPLECVRKIQSCGIEVWGGFIVGFDSDDVSVFSKQTEFIQNSGIVMAMVSLLSALPGTRLYERLKRENRLIEEASGNNTDFSINFLTNISHDVLIKGYKEIISSLYSSENYYKRILIFLKHYNPHFKESMDIKKIIILIKSMFIIGIFEEHRKYFWKMLFLSLFKYPNSFPKVMAMMIYYRHFRSVFS